MYGIRRDIVSMSVMARQKKVNSMRNTDGGFQLIVLMITAVAIAIVAAIALITN